MNKAIIAFTAAAMSATAYCADINLTLHADRRGAKIQPTMYGLFFEDINFAADGGLYAEKLINRSFEFHPDHFAGWKMSGNVELRSDGPFERNPHYVRLTGTGHKAKYTCIGNEGFFGVSTKAGEKYRLSLWARKCGERDARLIVNLTDPASHSASQSIAADTITVESQEWRKYTTVLTADESVSRGELRIILGKPEGEVDLEHISLFPADTYRGRDNGMRKDIATALAELNPRVLRFPGGCIVEGTDAETRYRWKNSVGPVENRPLNENRWQSTFTSRFYPQYFQSLGLGFYEYFLLAEDLRAEPLPVLNTGMICQYQNKKEEQIPLDSLGEFIRDAIDLIEFANGDTTTTWGALRGRMGHPAPFRMKYLAIGNEQWGPEYIERLEPFVAALRKAHPEIMIIGGSGPGSEGEKFDYLWPEMKRLGVDLVDEHFYRPEEWFLNQGNRYDSYDRRGPKVFAGEYACHGKGKKFNHFNAALCEAAFMTGMERNADIVHMATYAPLLAHVDGWQWRPDMIWFDNDTLVRTSSYYVQQMYSHNKGTHVVPLTVDGKPAAGNSGQRGLFASAVADTTANCYIVKAVNTGESPLEIAVSIKSPGNAQPDRTADTYTLSSPTLSAENTIDDPQQIVPHAGTVILSGRNILTDTIPAHTFRIYRIRMQ